MTEGLQTLDDYVENPYKAVYGLNSQSQTDTYEGGQLFLEVVADYLMSAPSALGGGGGSVARQSARLAATASRKGGMFSRLASRFGKRISDSVFGPCPNNTGVSLAEAGAAASRNGINMRMLELRYIEKPWTSGLYGSMFRVAKTKALFRGETGKIIVGLTRKGLQSPQTAVNTIAHELNHIRGVLKSGIPTGEDAANFAGDMAERFFR